MTKKGRQQKRHLTASMLSLLQLALARSASWAGLAALGCRSRAVAGTKAANGASGLRDCTLIAQHVCCDVAGWQV